MFEWHTGCVLHHTGALWGNNKVLMSSYIMFLFLVTSTPPPLIIQIYLITYFWTLCPEKRKKILLKWLQCALKFSYKQCVIFSPSVWPIKTSWELWSRWRACWGQDNWVFTAFFQILYAFKMSSRWVSHPTQKHFQKNNKINISYS